jgi:hypothetical protein
MAFDERSLSSYGGVLMLCWNDASVSPSGWRRAGSTSAIQRPSIIDHEMIEMPRWQKLLIAVGYEKPECLRQLRENLVFNGNPILHTEVDLACASRWTTSGR